MEHWNRWLDSPPGRYVLAWEQQQYDALVEDVFGFYALQCGLPQLDCLRTSRMASLIHAHTAADLVGAGELAGVNHAIGADGGHRGMATVRIGSFGELPFASQSLDLVVLPHVLEFADDPHEVLREVDRVLRPEGRVIVTGFNTISLWRLRQSWLRGLVAPFLPREGQFLGPPRLRDWLKLLSFEPERAHYGCFRPPCRTQTWLDRTQFIEAAGDRWWPICGAVYALSAVKRVRAMRLVGAIRRSTPASAPAAVANLRVVPAAGERARPSGRSAARAASLRVVDSAARRWSDGGGAGSP